MLILNRDSFLKPIDLAREPVEVPELGGAVYVRAMTAGERDRYEAEQIKAPGQDLRARLAAYTVCDESGSLLFTVFDIPVLSKLPAGPLSRIVDTALRLNRIGEEAATETEKN